VSKRRGNLGAEVQVVGVLGRENAGGGTEGAWGNMLGTEMAGPGFRFFRWMWTRKRKKSASYWEVVGFWRSVGENATKENIKKRFLRKTFLMGATTSLKGKT